MLKQRVITALVLAAAFVAVLFFFPPWVFALFIGTATGLAAAEWANLCHLITRAERVGYAVALLAVAFGLWLLLRLTALFTLQQLLIVSCLWWLVALWWIVTYPSSTAYWRSRAARMAMGGFVLVPCLLSLVFLRSLPSGQLLVVAVVMVVAAADIGAYFAGRAFGRHKLALRVSPGKSWEGVVGGAVAVALLGLVYALVRGANVPVVLAIILPAALVSVVGDLLESMLKRFRGVKDSGQLLPGHGGVLDRIDGLVAAVAVFTLAVITANRVW